MPIGDENWLVAERKPFVWETPKQAQLKNVSNFDIPA